jgi:hypothetical protein
VLDELAVLRVAVELYGNSLVWKIDLGGRRHEARGRRIGGLELGG